MLSAQIRSASAQLRSFRVLSTSIRRSAGVLAFAFSRRDLEGFLEVCDPEIRLVSRHLELDGSGHLRGHAAVRRW